MRLVFGRVGGPEKGCSRELRAHETVFAADHDAVRGPEIAVKERLLDKGRRNYPVRVRRGGQGISERIRALARRKENVQRCFD